MAEWSKAAVSKTVNGFTRSGVRIPFSPPLLLSSGSPIKTEFVIREPFGFQLFLCIFYLTDLWFRHYPVRLKSIFLLDDFSVSKSQQI